MCKTTLNFPPKSGPSYSVNLSKWKLLPPNFPGQKSSNHLISFPFANPSACCVNSTFKTYSESDYSSFFHLHHSFPRSHLSSILLASAVAPYSLAVRVTPRKCKSSHVNPLLRAFPSHSEYKLRSFSWPMSKVCWGHTQWMLVVAPSFTLEAFQCGQYILVTLWMRPYSLEPSYPLLGSYPFIILP